MNSFSKVLFLLQKRKEEMYPAYPNPRFWSYENGDYTLTEVQRNGRLKKLGKITDPQNRKVKTLSDYRLAFPNSSRVTNGFTIMVLSGKHERYVVGEMVNRIAVSPDGSSVIIVVDERGSGNFQLKIVGAGNGKDWETYTRVASYERIDKPSFGFISPDTYYIGGSESNELGSLDQFEGDYSESFETLFPLENDYYITMGEDISVKGSQQLRRISYSLFKIQVDGDSRKEIEIGKLPLYADFLTQGDEVPAVPGISSGTYTQEKFFESVRRVDRRKPPSWEGEKTILEGLEGKTPEELKEYYFSEWLPDSARADEWELSGNFVAGRYEYDTGDVTLRVWDIRQLKTDAFVPPVREVTYADGAILLSNGKFIGIDIEAEGAMKAYACCDAERIHKHMIQTSPIPRAVVDIVTGFL